MKHEVCVLGGQRIDQNSKKGWKRGFILEELIRRERRDGGEGEERGLRKGESEREKRDKRELS